MDFNKNKGKIKMNELETLMLDVTNTLNHNGFDEVKVVPNNAVFSIRVGYWEQIPASLRETMEEYHSIRIREMLLEDEDCGMLYNYTVFWELPQIEDEEPMSNCCSAPFTFPGWPDSDMCSQCKEHADKWDTDEEELELESLVDNNPDDGSWVGR